MVAATTLAVLDLLSKSTELRDRLEENAKVFRAAITKAGFDVKPGSHPIVPIMLSDESRTVEMARRLLDEGIYVTGFSYPVVPKGQARIRVQLSALHTREDLPGAGVVRERRVRFGDRRGKEGSMVKAEDKSKIQSLISDLNGLRSRDPQESKFKEWKDKAERNVEEVFGKGSSRRGGSSPSGSSTSPGAGRSQRCTSARRGEVSVHPGTGRRPKAPVEVPGELRHRQKITGRIIRMSI